ncbi:MAG: P1 family peptidase [Thermomicrobiales bacterium]|nr:P1 family peptidase [Thermomicrobiales bacterium]
MVAATTTISDVPGVNIGHTTLAPAKTGCTVIVFDEPALTAAEVRGAAPGTRDLDLLQSGRTVQRADAILLTGGSAFGLRAADGVMTVLATMGRGFPTPAIPVPIVPAAVIFDLANVQPEIPSMDDGALALRTATPLSQVETGQVGVGTGARWGNITGTPQDGGFYLAQIAVADGSVTAAVVVNAMGVINPEIDPRGFAIDAMTDPGFGHNTTLIAVITDVACSHQTLKRMCVAAHDALARVIWPSHTMADGDVAFASTVNDAPVERDLTMPLCLATELAVEAALRQAKP